MLAAAIIQGVQSEGVVATPKHFVCNDREDRRRGLETIVTSRALREIYLKPFQLALALGKPHAIMTAYNKLNGKKPRPIAEYFEGGMGISGSNYQRLVSSLPQLSPGKR